MELTADQKKILELFSNSQLAEKFYWTGGTLLASHYLHHRKSFDLDFFSEQPYSFHELNDWIQSTKTDIQWNQITSQKIYDRWEFICLKSDTDEIRIDFVFYNHGKKTLHPRERLNGILIDSLDDLAANKTVALVDRREPKDLIDIYFLLTRAHYSPEKLLHLVELKFGTRFPPSVLWNEAFRLFPMLSTLKPYLLGAPDEQTKLLHEIEVFIKDNSINYLNSQLV